MRFYKRPDGKLCGVKWREIAQQREGDLWVIGPVSGYVVSDRLSGEIRWYTGSVILRPVITDFLKNLSSFRKRLR